MMTHLLLIAMLSVSAAGTADDLLKNAKGQPGGDLAPLVFTATSWNPDGINFSFLGPQKVKVEVRVTRGNKDRPADAHLARYNVDVTSTPPEAKKTLTSAIGRVIARIKERQKQGPELRKLRGKGPERFRDDKGKRAGPPKTRSQSKPTHGMSVSTDGSLSPMLILCFFLLGLLLLSLPWAMEGARRQLVLPAESALPILMAWGLVALVQLVWVRPELVTVFAGYGTVAEAFEWRPVLKYGAASSALYGPLLHLYPASVDVVVATNTVLGLLSLPLAATLALRIAGTQGARPAAFAILLIGLSAVFMRDRASESVLVPMQFFLWVGWVHLDQWLRQGNRMSWLGWVSALGLAFHARPEVFVVGPVFFVAFCGLHFRTEHFKARRFWLGIGALVLAALAVPRAVEIFGFMGHAAASGDVPGLSGSAEGSWALFWERNALWIPEIFNPFIAVTALAGLVFLPMRGRFIAGGVWLSVILWQGLSTLDLPPVSVSRVQAPALTWVALLAAATLAACHGRGVRWKWGAVAVLMLSLVPWFGPGPPDWAPTNAQAFQRFWNRALPKVPAHEKTRCVVALSMSDAPRQIVTRLYPLTTLRVRSKALKSYGIGTYLETYQMPELRTCERLYVMGPQCYARFFGYDRERPKRLWEHPLCQRIRKEFRLEPIYEEQLPNLGNPDFPFYGRSETLRVGLFRLGERIKR